MTFLLTINSVNDPPTITGIPPSNQIKTIDEEQPLAIQFFVEDADGDPLEVTATSSGTYR